MLLRCYQGSGMLFTAAAIALLACGGSFGFSTPDQPADDSAATASRGAVPASELERVRQQRSRETIAAYDACPYAVFSRNYFARFTRDSQATPSMNEVALDASWAIVVPHGAAALTDIMAAHLREFLSERMGVTLPIRQQPRDQSIQSINRAIVLLDGGGGDPSIPESFTLQVEKWRIVVRGRDSAGLRDGVVKLVDLMGIRRAPILKMADQLYRPRVAVRLGVVPWMGSYRDLVFLGYNAVLVNTYLEGEESLFAISVSEAIPELKVRRRPEVLDRLIHTSQEAKRYGVKVYCQLNTRQKFSPDDPVFAAHPEIRGALTWKADGEYVLCTEHPLVQRYLMETVEELFRLAALDGVLLINGGESFYHCFMRSFGTPKGHTNCARCESLGAETVVANLSNHLRAAAHKANPHAEVIGWPYSAEHVWSADRYQIGVIEKLHPGAGILTEIEKDETIAKPDGVVKYIADYSIDLVGPGERAKRQVAACQAAGVTIHIKSEPELGFEAPRLPFIPCLDRWAARAEALVSLRPDGVWVFPYFRPNYGSTAAEVFKHAWWDPAEPTELVLDGLARRAAGDEAGPHLRAAWRHASQAIAWSPEQPAYYTGPYYLGPAHPMCVSPSAALPDVFYGQFLFMGEATDAEGLTWRPIFVTSPSGNVPVFGKFYRHMADCLQQAMEELELARPLVTPQHQLTFDAECSPLQWFYHTARTQANFYESCLLRDAVHVVADRRDKGATAAEPVDAQQCRALFDRWRAVLVDERANTEAALPVAEADMRLDCYYSSDHAFPHMADMIRAKLAILDREIAETLPQLQRRCGLE